MPKTITSQLGVVLDMTTDVHACSFTREHHIIELKERYDVRDH